MASCTSTVMKKLRRKRISPRRTVTEKIMQSAAENRPQQHAD